jgi:two-component system cell cycle response regulator
VPATFVGDVQDSGHIVVADDDRVTREYLTGLLEGHGFRVTTARSGAQALESCAGGEVTLVLLDVMMPGMTGLEVCRILKAGAEQRRQHLPIVLLTAKSDGESRVEGLRLGADDYVCKPFDERELLARVSNLVKVKQLHDEVMEARDQLERLAIRDELTGLYNHRYVQQRLDDEFKRSMRYKEPLACAMIDIDHFKRINDRFGHPVGDRVLARVAKRLEDATREVDVVARYGGEEFVLVLPSTHLSGALVVADRIRRTVGEESFEVDRIPVSVSVSIGVAVYPSRGVEAREALLEGADKALYTAKEGGRDRVAVFQDPPYVYQDQT